MSDTVGFIQKLPTQLVAAFRCLRGAWEGGRMCGPAQHTRTAWLCCGASTRIRAPQQTMVIWATHSFLQKMVIEQLARAPRRATLEEIQDASLLLHLVDISHPNAAAQCEAVLKVRVVGAGGHVFD